MRFLDGRRRRARARSRSGERRIDFNASDPVCATNDGDDIDLFCESVDRLFDYQEGGEDGFDDSTLRFPFATSDLPPAPGFLRATNTAIPASSAATTTAARITARTRELRLEMGRRGRDVQGGSSSASSSRSAPSRLTSAPPPPPPRGRGQGNWNGNRNWNGNASLSSLPVKPLLKVTPPPPPLDGVWGPRRVISRATSTGIASPPKKSHRPPPPNRRRSSGSDDVAATKRLSDRDASFNSESSPTCVIGESTIQRRPATACALPSSQRRAKPAPPPPPRRSSAGDEAPRRKTKKSPPRRASTADCHLPSERKAALYPPPPSRRRPSRPPELDRSALEGHDRESGPAASGSRVGPFMRRDYQLGEPLRRRDDAIVAPSRAAAEAAVDSLRTHDFAFVRGDEADGEEKFVYAILALRSRRHDGEREGGLEEVLTFVSGRSGETTDVRRGEWAARVRLPGDAGGAPTAGATAPAGVGARRRDAASREAGVSRRGSADDRRPEKVEDEATRSRRGSADDDRRSPREVKDDNFMEMLRRECYEATGVRIPEAIAVESQEEVDGLVSYVTDPADTQNGGARGGKTPKKENSIHFC